MEQIGKSHGFGSGDGDAERCVDRLKLCEGKEAKAAEAEMALGGHDADIFPPEIGLRLRDGQQLDKPFRRARRMKADDGQFVVGCAGITGMALMRGESRQSTSLVRTWSFELSPKK